MELQILGIQLVGIAIALLIAFETRVLYKKGRFKRKDIVIWSSVSVLLLIVALFPLTFANFLSLFTDIGRGLDALMLLGLLGAFALIFHVYIRNQETQRQITDLVRKVAIRMDEIEKKKPVKKKK